jgi:predicted GNAT family acetyltransferase
LLKSATRDHEQEIHDLVDRAFKFEQQWSGSFSKIAAPLHERIQQAFRSQINAAISLMHGSRIIAASCLCTDPDAAFHFISGPCVLPEYRSRGLGTALLIESLITLKASEVHVARAISKEGTIATKFVYRKLNSVAEPHPHGPFGDAD